MKNFKKLKVTKEGKMKIVEMHLLKVYPFTLSCMDKLLGDVILTRNVSLALFII